MQEPSASDPSLWQQPNGIGGQSLQDCRLTVPAGHVQSPSTQIGFSSSPAPHCSTQATLVVPSQLPGSPGSPGSGGLGSEPSPHPTVTVTTASSFWRSSSHRPGQSTVSVGAVAGST